MKVRIPSWKKIRRALYALVGVTLLFASLFVGLVYFAVDGSVWFVLDHLTIFGQN